MAELFAGIIGLVSAILTWWLSSGKVEADINARKVEKLEAAEAAAAKKRVEEFNEKAKTATTASTAAELLAEATRRSPRPR